MNFHPSFNIKKKNSNRRKFFIGVFVFVIAFLVGIPVFNILKSVLYNTSVVGMRNANKISEVFDTGSILLKSKKELRNKISELEKELDATRTELFSVNSAISENKELRMILGNTPVDSNRVVVGILAKPNRSIYGTMILDISNHNNIFVGDSVYALGNIRIGEIISIKNKIAIVRMFSAPNNEVYVITKDGIEIKATGRGNGNFILNVPNDMEIKKGDNLFLSSSKTILIAQIKKIVFDARNPMKQVFAVSPVNVQNIRFVQIEK